MDEDEDGDEHEDQHDHECGVEILHQMLTIRTHAA